ncbi:MAG: PIN domain-containing protein, partial [Acidimicrobiales bacterium]|nr:PIN domain-containing protein [Acidimicrobiales bacterium]
MATYYADASALVKLVRDEPESAALRTFVSGDHLVSCELVLTELPRATRRALAMDKSLPPDILMQRSQEVLDVIALRPLDRVLLLAAGALSEPSL